MKKELFRKTALERLSTPEQLDQIMQVTNPRGWIALLAAVIMVFAGLLWSIFGELPTKISGRGILVKSGGVLEIQTNSGGRIISLLLQEADSVTKGQLVAIIAKPEIEVEITNAQETIRDLQREYQTQKDAGQEEIRRQKNYFAQQREILRRSLDIYYADADALANKLAAQEELFKDGLVTRQTINETRSQLNLTKQQAEHAKNELNQIAVKELQLVREHSQQLMNIEFKVNEATRKLKLLSDNFELTSRVISPYSGRVLEIMANEGDIVVSGMPLCSLEPVTAYGEKLEAIVFVPPTEGKKVKSDMEVFLAPSTVRQEEFGLMIGNVRYVAEYPSTVQGMLRVLGNEQLVHDLSAGSTPIALTVDLILDSSTVSSYAWTSPKGPDAKVYSGTLCTATITIRKQSPISLVFPILRESVGM